MLELTCTETDDRLVTIETVNKPLVNRPHLLCGNTVYSRWVFAVHLLHIAREIQQLILLNQPIIKRAEMSTLPIYAEKVIVC